jgi:hypothetical protein
MNQQTPKLFRFVPASLLEKQMTIARSIVTGLVPAIFPAFLHLAQPSTASADPLECKQVPVDAKWVVHVDMDAARDTRLWAAINGKLSDNDEFQNGIHQIEQLTNAQFPRDLHDVTLYGRSSDQQAGVVIVHAHVDRHQIETFLKMNQGYASKTVGDYEILTWDDKGKSMHGAFHDDSTIIIANSEELVRDGLEVMDGKSECIKDDSPLAAGTKPKLLASIATADFGSLQKEGPAQSPMLGQVKNGWISVSESDGNAVVKADIVSDTPESATQLGQSIDGVKAMLGLAGNVKGGKNGQPSPPQVLAPFVKTLTWKKDDDSLMIEWPINIDKAKDAIAVLSKKNVPAQ